MAAFGLGFWRRRRSRYFDATPRFFDRNAYHQFVANNLFAAPQETALQIDHIEATSIGCERYRILVKVPDKAIPQ
jgi:hypothetical protein